MTILITGGAGYIGSHVALNLIDAGYKVTIIDDLSTGNDNLIPNNRLLHTHSGNRCMASERNTF